MDREYVVSLSLKYLEFLYVRLFPAGVGSLFLPETSTFDSSLDGSKAMRQHDSGRFDDTPEWLEGSDPRNTAAGVSNDEFVKHDLSTRRRVAYFLIRDVRVLSTLTTFLREIATQPLFESMWLHVTRSEIYQKMLVAINRAVLQVSRETGQFELVPEDPYAEVKQNQNEDEDAFRSTVRATGEGLSPLTHHNKECTWHLVFENIVICLRAALSQSLYVGPDPKRLPLVNALLEQPAGNDKKEFWRWAQQDRLVLHQEAQTFLSGIVFR